jgi:hypothetical protein
MLVSSVLTGNMSHPIAPITNVSRSRMSRAPMGLALLLACVSHCAAAQGTNLTSVDRATLQVLVEIASNPSTEPAKERAIEDVFGRIQQINAEAHIPANLLNATPDERFKRLVAARGTLTTDYLVAMTRSYARFRAAEEAGDLEWASKHLTSSHMYGALASNDVKAEAKADAAQAERYRSQEFAKRRSRESATAVISSFKQVGLSSEHRQLLLDGGHSSADVDALQKELASSGEQMGYSIVELCEHLAQFRHNLAGWLDGFSKGETDDSLSPKSNSFVVGNPTERVEVVDLYIRRISIPDDWKVTVATEPQRATTDPAQKSGSPRVEEVKPGVQYRVSLPAKAQAKVISTIIPAGKTGANTTTRWAIEGKIGNELISGMVHELKVPYVVADLTLPPVGSDDSERDDLAKRPPYPRYVTAALLFGLLVVVFSIALFWRMRRTTVKERV